MVSEALSEQSFRPPTRPPPKSKAAFNMGEWRFRRRGRQVPSLRNPALTVAPASFCEPLQADRCPRRICRRPAAATGQRVGVPAVPCDNWKSGSGQALFHENVIARATLPEERRNAVLIRHLIDDRDHGRLANR